ncbi:hypothetical protein PtA15_15A98 [Puccinia triticina]|uniref:Uncharacterized protein n=1 Tax=Puccinia triticina TaxID=208348 RepID=A0ABY7D9W4_9BASI|nr:uncharacterized protein PtA15_15A98 [Puccinia triticina]WAQ91707.1 hypothetical protein PtA15_15A98 [Puccinia triticina]WAR62507.1 hypothetical protein PtB15_15B92 [Puccinia triticina]
MAWQRRYYKLEAQLTQAQKRINNLTKAKLADLKAKLLSSQVLAHKLLTNLASSQPIIQALKASLSTLKQDSAGQLE